MHSHRRTSRIAAAKKRVVLAVHTDLLAKPVAITNADRVKYISPIVDGDDKVTKKAVKIINGYLYGVRLEVIGRDDEYSEKKLISKLIKLCGVEAAKYLLFVDSMEGRSSPSPSRSPATQTACRHSRRPLQATSGRGSFIVSAAS